ncbi:hypothetical protein MASR1M31_02620 [Porphyromonadaceae bacterium]
MINGLYNDIRNVYLKVKHLEPFKYIYWTIGEVIEDTISLFSLIWVPIVGSIAISFFFIDEFPLLWVQVLIWVNLVIFLSVPLPLFLRLYFIYHRAPRKRLEWLISLLIPIAGNNIKMDDGRFFHLFFRFKDREYFTLIETFDKKKLLFRQQFMLCIGFLFTDSYTEKKMQRLSGEIISYLEGKEYAEYFVWNDSSMRVYIPLENVTTELVSDILNQFLYLEARFKIKPADHTRMVVRNPWDTPTESTKDSK